MRTRANTGQCLRTLRARRPEPSGSMTCVKLAPHVIQKLLKTLLFVCATFVPVCAVKIIVCAVKGFK